MQNRFPYYRYRHWRASVCLLLVRQLLPESSQICEISRKFTTCWVISLSQRAVSLRPNHCGRWPLVQSKVQHQKPRQGPWWPHTNNHGRQCPCNPLWSGSKECVQWYLRALERGPNCCWGQSQDWNRGDWYSLELRYHLQVLKYWYAARKQPKLAGCPVARYDQGALHCLDEDCRSSKFQKAMGPYSWWTRARKIHPWNQQPVSGETILGSKEFCFIDYECSWWQELLPSGMLHHSRHPLHAFCLRILRSLHEKKKQQ